MLHIEPRLHALPHNCLAEVMLYLPVGSARDCSLVCRALFEKLQQDVVWQPLCARDHFPMRPIDGSFKKRYQYERNLESGRFTWRFIQSPPFCPLNPAAQYCMADGKLAIKNMFNPMIVRDLKTNIQFEIVVLASINSKITTIQDNHLFHEEIEYPSGVQYTKTHIYDLALRKVVKTFENLNNFAFCGSKLIKPNSDLSGVEIHDVQQAPGLESRPLPQGLHVSCIAASNKHLFVGTTEGHICIWNEETKIFTDHPITQSSSHKKIKIERLIISDDLLIVSQLNRKPGTGYKITFWDIKTGELQHSLPECYKDVAYSEKKVFL